MVDQLIPALARANSAAMTAVAARVVAAVAVAVAGISPLGPTALAAQAGEGWDSPRVLEMVERARDRRREPVLDEALQSYRAEVGGHIYFFVDSPEHPDPVLLRSDQVALDLYWAYPDRVKQVIRGMRQEEQFPIRDFYYYLDRYTVIHDGFGDEIRVGEGRDVRNVPHPLALDAETTYHYRLTDSTTIRLPGADAPIRVYEIQVRPRSFDTPAIVGSLFVERARADLVRLSFTFTRAAYLDPRNERVEVMLENGLWEGRYWLPREQRLLVRRELPQFDFGVGTVIRAALQVTNYDLNPPLPGGFFVGPPVVLGTSRSALPDYPFATGLFDGFEAVGLAPGQEPATLGEVNVDAIAGRILREQYLSGISRMRLFVPGASSVVRYGRSEGLFTGLGASRALGRSHLAAHAGYAWGSGDPVGELSWRSAGPGVRMRPFASAYLNRPVDLGLRQPAGGIISTGAAAFGNDFRDIHPATGLSAGTQVGSAGTGVLRLGLTGESHRAPVQAETAAPFAGDDEGFRPVAPAEDGSRFFLDASYERRLPLGPLAVTGRPALEIGYADFQDDAGAFARARLGLNATWVSNGRTAGAELRATGAAAFGATPPQHLWYLGGRNTLPGHPFHQYVGDRAALVDLTGWRQVIGEYIQLRLIAAAGWSDVSESPPLPGWVPGLTPWQPAPTDGIRASVGAGLGLLHGIVRLDYAIRTDTGKGSFILSVDPRLWGFL